MLVEGEIGKKDLQKIYDDYEKLIKIEPADGRHFKKTHGFFVSIDILKAFIEQAEKQNNNNKKIYCRFGVTLPHQTTCYKPYADISNSLTVSFFIADENNNIKEDVGDNVLVAGFKASQPVKNPSGDQDIDITCCGNPHGYGVINK